MLIRYFAEMSSTPMGAASLWWLGELRKLTITRPTLSIRLLSAGGFATLEGGWARHVDLMSTPLTPDFLNVVCCDADAWRREVAYGVAELYTANIRNVLLIPKGMHDRQRSITAPQVASAMKYEAIVVDPADASWWAQWNPKSPLLCWNAPQALEIALGLVPREGKVPEAVADHAYLSAGDTAAASGDVAYAGCFLCGRPRREHSA